MKVFAQSDALNRLPHHFFANFMKKVAEVEEKYDDVINLGQGNPDQPTPDHIVRKLKEATDNPLYHGYSPFDGYLFLKEAIATYYKREYDVDIDPKTEVAIIGGTKTGLVEVSRCLLNEGDVALIPDPGYPDYLSGIALAGGKAHMMPLYAENGFHPNYDDISDDILAKTKMMFLNYPSNPTGVVASEQLFEDTVSLANEHDICVVHDFAYGAIGFDGKKPLSFLQIPGAKDVGIETMSLSKTFNMAGWRVGFVVGNQSVVSALELVQDHYFCSLFGGIQEAAAYALTADQTCVHSLVDMYERRRNTLVKAAKEIGWDMEAPQGSFFAWLPVPAGYTSEELAELILEKARVVVVPGRGFGELGEGYVRIGLLCDEDTLQEAMNRIAKLNLFSSK